uniref:Uncharacterized protein n=1 Tax=Onchocerca volvulus TaxID=6282 RepID=A0A8R1TUK2_ONCVO
MPKPVTCSLKSDSILINPCRRLTVRQIIHNLCDRFNVPDAALTGFNIGNFVEQAIKVEAGELPSFRNQSSRREANFNQKNELLIQASKLLESDPEFAPEPEIILLPKPEQEPEPELAEEPEPESDLIQKLEPIPEYEAELEFLPEPKPCFPVFAISQATLPCEPSPGTEESELVSGPEPQLHRLELSEEAEEIP